MKNQFGVPYAATASGSTSATATISGVALRTIYITEVSASSDKSGSSILVKDGNTVIWQDLVGAGNYRMNFITPLRVTMGNDATVTVDGTASSRANVSAFVLNNS